MNTVEREKVGDWSEAVSYTHLDVYKRQEKRQDLIPKSIGQPAVGFNSMRK